MWSRPFWDCASRPLTGQSSPVMCCRRRMMKPKASRRRNYRRALAPSQKTFASFLESAVQRPPLQLLRPPPPPPPPRPSPPLQPLSPREQSRLPISAKLPPVDRGSSSDSRPSTAWNSTWPALALSIKTRIKTILCCCCSRRRPEVPSRRFALSVVGPPDRRRNWCQVSNVTILPNSLSLYIYRCCLREHSIPFCLHWPTTTAEEEETFWSALVSLDSSEQVSNVLPRMREPNFCFAFSLLVLLRAALFVEKKKLRRRRNRAPE